MAAPPPVTVDLSVPMSGRAVLARCFQAYPGVLSRSLVILAPLVPLCIAWALLSSAWLLDRGARVSPVQELVLLAADVGLLAATLWAGAAITRVAVLAWHGQAEAVGAGVRAVIPALLPLFGVAVIASVGIAAAGMLLVVPGVMLGGLWMLAPVMVIRENATPFSALRRSWHLQRPQLWRAAGYWLVGIFLTFVLSAVGAVPVVALVHDLRPSLRHVSAPTWTLMTNMLAEFVGLLGVALPFVALLAAGMDTTARSLMNEPLSGAGPDTLAPSV